MELREALRLQLWAMDYDDKIDLWNDYSWNPIYNMEAFDTQFNELKPFELAKLVSRSYEFYPDEPMFWLDDDGLLVSGSFSDCPYNENKLIEFIMCSDKDLCSDPAITQLLKKYGK